MNKTVLLIKKKVCVPRKSPLPIVSEAKFAFVFCIASWSGLSLLPGARTLASYPTLSHVPDPDLGPPSSPGKVPGQFTNVSFLSSKQSFVPDRRSE